MPRCAITGKDFVVTPEESALRRSLGAEDPVCHPVFRFIQLAAFWQHWNLHKRVCDKTGNSMISVFSEHCPYPVWHKDEWLQHADPPSAQLDPSHPLFPQMWELFRRCPIPHNIGAGNDNCEYTDDWWYSKNCYLCHSGVECEDLRCCYRTIRVRDSHFCVFSLDSELSVDLINCVSCFQVRFAYNCRDCRDSSFLYDCRNCSDCAFSCNLRNKRFCFFNEQLSEEAYRRRLGEWEFRSRAVYKRAIDAFQDILRTKAWHRALFVDRSENADGNYLDSCKNVLNGFFLSNETEDCANVLRAGFAKDCVDCVSSYASERAYCCALPQDKCYEVRFSYNLIQCKWVEYCAHCHHCESCFGCCGLVGKKHHIFNKPYAPEEYESAKSRIVEAMKRHGEYGMFFPGHFAAHPYAESLAAFYWSLDDKTLEQWGLRPGHEQPRTLDALPASEVPDRSDEAREDLPSSVFWDDVAQRPFQVQQADIDVAGSLGTPLPWCHYARRLMENFRFIPFNGELRETRCARCTAALRTSWPETFDPRILCEDCYRKEVY